MKLAILSDTRLPTSPHYPGHGLGQMVHVIATGLAERGHDVTLLAAPGSEFEGGRLITVTDEMDMLNHLSGGYGAFLDNTHTHVTGQIGGLPAIQVSHDREHAPARNAVFPGRLHQRWHGFTDQRSRIIPYGIECHEVAEWGQRRGGYVAYMGTFYPPKQPLAALEAARLAGKKLLMVGHTPPAPPPGAYYLGVLAGCDKYEFLYHADALIYPSTIECAPVTVLEAQSVGTPVIVSAFGGSRDNMLPNQTGFVCGDIEEMALGLTRIHEIEREACRQFVAERHSKARMIDQYETLLNEVASGGNW